MAERPMAPGYASPGLRWGLLLEDHPGATHTFELARGDDSRIDLPAGWGRDGQYCLAIITFPRREGEAQREPVHGYKPAGANGKPDDWVVLSTKSLGRALKRAGYPDHLPDLKAVVLWRQRAAEIRAIHLGIRAVGATAEQVEQALDEAQGGPDHDEDAGEPTGDDASDAPDAATGEVTMPEGWDELTDGDRDAMTRWILEENRSWSSKVAAAKVRQLLDARAKLDNETVFTARTDQAGPATLRAGYLAVAGEMPEDARSTFLHSLAAKGIFLEDSGSGSAELTDEQVFVIDGLLDAAVAQVPA